MPELITRPMIQPRVTPNIRPHPHGAGFRKEKLLYIPSLAPIALIIPISRRRSRMAITSVLTIPSEATASARLPNMPRKMSRTVKNFAVCAWRRERKKC